ncbi:HlyD family secretion protein [Pseudodonghicola flavimaris]|uniref:HlyD family efflux transporter periplasmic adaptor subunit n=1 Tax=Pseudodonghicola flavimaris TaxID=3050036 RepID=A0ABT7F6C5_9RHOB|nr:HlyD family efflux transporter periplasmic adaptor subunit [Pseudodonghicola flavimaris]MDK3020161.1 HlyD family efflux transporter periplasmic adaptor subunit [Pseudodonghicola flavimaris]
MRFQFPFRILGAAALALALALPTAPLRAEGSFEKLLQRFGGADRYENIVSSNGRLEAQSVEVATKYAGRLTAVTAHEGDIVEAGDVIGQIDDRDAKAKLTSAQAAVLSAKASKQMAEASVMQADSALSVARTNYNRIVKLHEEGHAADSVLDDATNTLKAAEAALASSKAQVSSADATIAAAEADVQSLQISLDDLTIRAPIRGRVLYRLHEPGEVISAGASIITLLDLTQVYMNIYLPAPAVGPLVLNDEARIILDPVPQFVVPARITFIAPQSQFTPKSVETQEEREDLVFRVKLTIPHDLLEKFEDQVKVGVRGIGFVRTAAAAEWPDDLKVNVPQ